jgi:transcriptional regulator GlxA family with amidase domain
MDSLVTPQPTSPLRVGFILARHFTLSAFSLFVDTLRLASDVEDRSGRLRCNWEVISSTPQLIKASCGVQLAPTERLGRPERFDYIAVVGGLLDVEEPIDAETVAFLKAAAAKGVPLVGVCTGSFILAAAGLLRDRLACVSWLHHEAYRARFPRHRATSQRLFWEDVGIITCAGGSAVADLAAVLVKRHVGEDAERNALEILQVDRWREGGEMQSRTPLALSFDGDPRIKASLQFMEQNIDEKIRVDEVARAVGVSRRQLERLFHEKTGISPGEALSKIRMNKAMFLVERTSRPLIEIALEVGFENSSHFGRKFRKNFGISPIRLRAERRARGNAELSDQLMTGD